MRAFSILTAQGTQSRLGSACASIAADLRHAFKLAVRGKAFYLPAIAVFALGIATNTAAFSVIDRMLFRPLPYFEPSQLVQVHLFTSDTPRGGRRALLPLELTEVLQDQRQIFDGVAWTTAEQVPVAPEQGHAPVVLTPVSLHTFDVLGIHPIRGRFFERADIAAAEDPIVLTATTWRRRFGESAIPMAAWHLGDRTYRVVGVLPDDFLLPSSRFIAPIDGVLLVERRFNLSPIRQRASIVTVAPFARLANGLTPEAALAAVNGVVRSYPWRSASLRQLALGDTKATITVLPLQSGLTFLHSSYLWAISVTVWLVLVTVCLNLSTLLVARNLARQREMAVRVAIGASQWRLRRLIVLETLIIGAIGSGIALIIVRWAQPILLASVPAIFRQFVVSPFDLRLFSGTVIAGVGAGVVASLIPAYRATQDDGLSVLAGDRSRAGGRRSRSGSALLCFQAIVGTCVLVSAAAAVGPILTLYFTNPGFELNGLFRVSVPHGYLGELTDAGTGRARRVKQVLDAIRDTGHVSSAAVAIPIPIGDASVPSEFWRSQQMSGYTYGVSAALFSTLGTRMRAGRSFEEDEEQATASAVAIINDAGRNALWPGASRGESLGRSVTVDNRARVIVGVVSDFARHPNEQPEPMLFLPVNDASVVSRESAISVLVRSQSSAGPDRQLLDANLNSRFESNNVSLEAVEGAWYPELEKPRFLAILFGGLGIVISVLTASGAYSLARLELLGRRHEIGVRIALGASRTAVTRIVCARVAAAIVIGISGGVGLAWCLGKSTDGLLFDVRQVRASAYVTAAFCMGIAASLACVRPILMSQRTDPRQLME